MKPSTPGSSPAWPEQRSRQYVSSAPSTPHILDDRPRWARSAVRREPIRSDEASKFCDERILVTGRQSKSCLENGSNGMSAYLNSCLAKKYVSHEFLYKAQSLCELVALPSIPKQSVPAFARQAHFESNWRQRKRALSMTSVLLSLCTPRTQEICLHALIRNERRVSATNTPEYRSRHARRFLPISTIS